jgi:steroid 5-alpha reductase family enzyme
MRAWADPYSPAVYFLHTILGSLGVLLALIALAKKKGGTGHVRSGWGFVIAVGVAACTAIVFSATQQSPLSIASALMVLGLVWGAVLAIRPTSPGVRLGEWGRDGIGGGSLVDPGARVGVRRVALAPHRALSPRR